MNQFFAACMLVALSNTAFSQGSLPTPETPSPTATPVVSDAAPAIKFTGYADTYYASDNDVNASANRSVLSSLNTNKDKFGFNLIQMTCNVEATNYRGKLTLHYGDLAQSAWITTGSDVLTNTSLIQEGFVGMKLHDGLWLDAGYFLTHIGGEAITPKDNWLSTIAIVTQFEPFYQAGVRLSYDMSSTVSAQVHVLNGYNRFTDNNSQKSVGYYVGYKPSDTFSASLSGIVGNEQSTGTDKALRVYNNALICYAPTENVMLKGQLDVAQQQIPTGGHSTMVGGYVAARYVLSEYFSVSSRGEYYNDKSGMLTGSYNLAAFGETLGFEYKPNSHTYIRLETRAIQQDKASSEIFASTAGKSFSRLEEVFSVGVIF